MEKMLRQLEEIRERSEHTDSLVVALGNGKEVFGFEESETTAIEAYIACGYWVVNNFLNGRPMGLGI